jgi:hypothetical protein
MLSVQVLDKLPETLTVNRTLWGRIREAVLENAAALKDGKVLEFTVDDKKVCTSGQSAIQQLNGRGVLVGYRLRTRTTPIDGRDGKWKLYVYAEQRG